MISFGRVLSMSRNPADTLSIRHTEKGCMKIFLFVDLYIFETYLKPKFLVYENQPFFPIK